MVEDKKAMDVKYREMREDYNFEKRKRDAAKENAENIKQQMSEQKHMRM